MDHPTTLTTFLLQTPSTVTSVELVGSWDNFRKRYPMEKDLRRGRGSWRGCHAFQDISFDGPSYMAGRARDGGLKMGARYWYYYVLDGDVDYHNAAEPATTACPLLPGQAMNVLEVPFELGPEQPRDRSQSAAGVAQSTVTSTPARTRTMDPADKFMKPRPAPTPRRNRLGSAPTSLLKKWIGLSSAALPGTAACPFRRASTFPQAKASSHVDHSSTVSLTSAPEVQRRPSRLSRLADPTTNNPYQEPQEPRNEPAASRERRSTAYSPRQKVGSEADLRQVKGSSMATDASPHGLFVNPVERMRSWEDDVQLDYCPEAPSDVLDRTSYSHRRQPSVLPEPFDPLLENPELVVPAPDEVSSPPKRPNMLLATHLPSYYSEVSSLGIHQPVTSHFSMYSTPTTARSINSRLSFDPDTTFLPDMMDSQLDAPLGALSPTISDGNGGYSSAGSTTEDDLERRRGLPGIFDAMHIQDDWFDGEDHEDNDDPSSPLQRHHSNFYGYRLPADPAHSSSEDTLRKLTGSRPGVMACGPVPSSTGPSTRNEGFLLKGCWTGVNDAAAVDPAERVPEMRSIFDELGYLGDVIATD